MADYITAEELRVELDLAPDDVASLSDARAARLIRFAQVVIDNALGPRPVYNDGPQAGRKVAEADVDSWQWEPLKAAVAVLAARLHRNPELMDSTAWSTVSGPDFSRSGPAGRIYGDEVVALMNATGLIPRGARARP